MPVLTKVGMRNSHYTESRAVASNLTSLVPLSSPAFQS